MTTRRKIAWTSASRRTTKRRPTPRTGWTSASSSSALPRPSATATKMTTMAQSRRRRSGGLVGTLSKTFSNVRGVGGSIDPTSRTIDPKGALILEGVSVAEVGVERGEDEQGELALAIELRGRLNGTQEAINPLILASPDLAALLIAQITAVARSGRVGPELDHCLAARMEEALGGG